MEAKYLPLVLLPLKLSDESAVLLLDYFYDLTQTLEQHYARIKLGNRNSRPVTEFLCSTAAAVTRLGALLLEQNDEWSLQRR